MKKKRKNKQRPTFVERLLKKWGKILGWNKRQSDFAKSEIKAYPKTKKIKIKNIELAANDKTSNLQPYVDKVLKALGHSDALVTDESYVTDLIDIFFNRTETDRELKKLSKKLKVKVSINDHVWQVAERMKNGK